MTQITVALFGAFRDYNEDSLISLDAGSLQTVAQLKAALSASFDGAQPYTDLLARSRIADAKQIFSDTDPLPKLPKLPKLSNAVELALLPPVNGG